jgi:hypothetical protein
MCVAGRLQKQERIFGIVGGYLSPGKESEARLGGNVLPGVNDFSHVGASLLGRVSIQRAAGLRQAQGTCGATPPIACAEQPDG